MALTAGAWAGPPPLKFDHVWLAVKPGAPERAVLEKAGFHFSPTVNRHDGQGTASVTIEFENSFLELIWPDRDVPIDPGFERAAEKFKQRTDWRTSGWCPIGVGMSYQDESPVTMPSTTWSVSPEWLKPYKMDILTAREDAKSPSLFAKPSKRSTDEAANRKAAMPGSSRYEEFHHPNGAKRITGVRLITPPGYQPVEALKFVRDAGVLSYTPGKEWLVELTFDTGSQGKTKDLRPTLPLLIRY